MANLQVVKSLSFVLTAIFGFALNAQVLQPLGNGIPGKVVASYASGNDYLALYDDINSSADQDYSLAKWNGLYWEYFPGLSIPSLAIATEGDYVFQSIAIFNNEIYVGAYIANAKVDAIEPINHLYKYSNGNWVNVPGAVKSKNYGIYDMTVWNGKLIVAGKFLDTFSGNKVDNIAAYDGSTWVQLGSNNNNQGTNGEINVLMPSGNRLYVAGNFTHFGGSLTGNIAYYTDNNGNWGGIGSPFTEPIKQLAQVGTDIYAMDENALGIGRVRKFKSSAWSAEIPFSGYTKAEVTTIAGGSKALYIGGNFDLNGKVHNLAVFDGANLRATDNRFDLNFQLNQRGSDAYVWGDFKELGTDIKYFSPIIEDAGNAVGVVYHDENNNCIQDNNEALLNNVSLVFTNENGKQFFAYTNDNGVYSTYLKAGLYTVYINGGKHWKKLCSSGNFVFIKDGEYASTYLGMHIQPNTSDVGIKTVTNSINKVSAGQEQQMVIHLYNHGSKTINGATVQLKHDNRLLDFNSEPLASNYSGNEATFTILNLKPRETAQITVSFKLPINTTASDKFNIQVNGGTLLNGADIDLKDNSDSLQYGTQTGSESNVTKNAKCGDTLAIGNRQLCYRMEYVNGTGEFVKRVVLIDTLDSDLKIDNFVYPFYTAKNIKFDVNADRILVIDIPEANLTDREFVPNSSFGIVDLDIMLSQRLPHGTVLTNMILADYDNKYSFRSNMTRVLVYDKTASNSGVFPQVLGVYPNPSQGQFKVVSAQGKSLGTIEVYNSVGKKVYSIDCNASETQLNLGQLSTGTYYLKTDLGAQLIQVVR